MTEDLRSKPTTKQATPQCYARLERQFPDISQACGGFDLQRTNWRDGRWYFRYDIYGR